MASVQTLEHGRKQALHALVSSLAPNAGEHGKLDGAQVSALSARLDQIMGNIGGADSGETGRRNEKGELVNEEGLPIVDISEPVIGDTEPLETPAEFPAALDAPGPSLQKRPLSDLERAQARARTNRILDMLEAEEKQEAERERAHRRQANTEHAATDAEEAQAEEARRLAAREMQKRMGKALLRNIAEQREQEERSKEAEEAAAVAARASPATATLKPRKSVSFANVPEVDKETPRPKPSAAWGDVSLGALRAGMPKAKLRAEMLSRQPMKLEVVERVPGGQSREPEVQCDSDDESDPELLGDFRHGDDEEEDEEETPPLDGEFDDSGDSSKSDEDPEEEDEPGNFDFTQASLQREVALEYFRLRETIGVDTHQVMTAHTHEGEDEWNQPEVPLEASLASKPPKPGISRFKADRQANAVRLGSGDASVSLGASVLSKDRSDTLQKAIRTGKFAHGKLVGGPTGDSESEDEESSGNRRRILDMLKAGVTTADDVPPQSTDANAGSGAPAPVGNGVQRSASPSSPFIPGSAPPPSASRILAERAAYRRPDHSATAGPSKLRLDSVSQPVSSANSVTQRSQVAAATDDKESPNASGTFSKPPTPIILPQRTPRPATQQQQESRNAFAAPQMRPEPAVLNTLVIDSPSFPRPGTAPGSGGEGGRPPVLVNEVRESSRGPGRGRDGPPPPAPPASAPARVSRFRAERM